MNRIHSILIAVVTTVAFTFAGLALTGCGQKSEPAAPPVKTTSAPAPAPAMEMPAATVAGYTCPMHADVHSDKPGKCPKCGMALVPVKPAAAVDYTCPMHPDVHSDKPGKCPTCGMALVPAEKSTDSK